MSTFDDSLDDYLNATDTFGATGNVTAVADRAQVSSKFAISQTATFSERLTVSEPYLAYDYQAVVVVAEIAKIKSQAFAGSTFNTTFSDQLKIVDLVFRAMGASIVENMTAQDTLAIAWAIVVAQRLKLMDNLSLSGTFGLLLVDMMRISAKASYALGGGWSDGLTAHDAPSPLWGFSGALSDHLTVTPGLTGTLLFQITMAESATIEDADLLTAIYNGLLQDNLIITGGMVDPGGGYTAWAVNTRTEAVTEYQSWQFNSFASLGGRYLGANSEGLWALDGPTDNGQNIISDVKGGYMQMTGSHFTQLTEVYLGLRTDTNASDWVLKLHTPGDRVYVYKVTPRNLATTKVNVGKGFRHRYVAFELITPGPDFSLDTIEFVPISSKRRV
jgi:hypothetical protein